MALQAHDIMTSEVETAHPDEEVSEVLTRLARAAFNGLPVVEDDRVVGIVTQSDLVALFHADDQVMWIPVGVPPFSDTLPYALDVSLDELDLGLDLVENADKPISEIMTCDVITVRADAQLDEILDVFTDEDRDINRVPVLEDDRIVGIVTREDLLYALEAERTGTEIG